MRYVPEVRLKYLRRQIQRRCYRQNVVAAIPTLLKLVVALFKRNRKYEYHEDVQKHLQQVETEYEIVKTKRQRHKK